jgi:hypothetical protein
MCVCVCVSGVCVCVYKDCTHHSLSMLCSWSDRFLSSSVIFKAYSTASCLYRWYRSCNHMAQPTFESASCPHRRSKHRNRKALTHTHTCVSRPSNDARWMHLLLGLELVQSCHAVAQQVLDVSHVTLLYHRLLHAHASPRRRFASNFGLQMFTIYIYTHTHTHTYLQYMFTMYIYICMYMYVCMYTY